MTRPRLAVLLSALTLALAGPAAWGQEAPPPAGVPAPSRQDDDWRQFRGAFPYHLQTIAVSRAAPDGTRTLIVSEPPPHATVEGLVAVDRARLADARVKQWGVGFDGWVKDVVVRLPRTTDADCQELTRKLSVYLFGTDYKAAALPLPADRAAAATRYPLDVAVRTTELEDWYAGRDFAPVGGGAARKLEGAPAGVYLSQQPGLVVWVVPKRGLADRRADARAFALDSDLVLGAVAVRDSVAVFGRERIAPVTVLPPLRAEMILALAASTGRSLGQSYERTAFAAGSSHARWDWAPIYLSPELLDTEYGSVLNLTDQLLKGWTQFATTQYYNFDYPTPSRLPFDGPLSLQLRATRLVFNWNTVGFGLRSDTGTRSVYAVTRTGALPVIYQPERGGPAVANPLAGPGDAAKATRQAEEQGYIYFATLNDPLLARAVQYATLYQLFQVFKVSAEAPEWPTWNQSQALAGVASRVLTALREAGEKDVQRAVDAVLADVRERARAANTPLPVDEPALSKKLAGELVLTRDRYRPFYGKHQAGGERVVAALLGGGRDFDPTRLADVPDIKSILRDAAPALTSLRDPRLVARLCAVGELQKEFSRSRPGTKNPWLQTPTVVYSRSLGFQAQATGGHSLDPTATRVVRDPNQPRGRVRVGEDREVFCHPDDAPVVERQARLIARSDDPGSLRSALEGLLQQPPGEGPREPSAALARAAEYQPAGRGFSPTEHHPRAADGSPPAPPPPRPPGTLPPGDAPPPGPRWDAPAAEVLCIRQGGGRATVERQAERGGKVEVVSREYWNQHDLLHALTAEFEAGGRTPDRRPLRLVFEAGFTEAQVRRVMDGLSLHATRTRSDRITVSYRGRAPGAAERWASPVTRVAVEADSVAVEPQVVRGGVTGSRVRASFDATTGDGRSSMTVEVFAAAVAPEARAVQRSVETSAALAERRGVRLGDLAPAVYENLLNDLNAPRAGSAGDFRYSGIGDVVITRFEHGGRTLGVLVSARP